MAKPPHYSTHWWTHSHVTSHRVVCLCTSLVCAWKQLLSSGSDVTHWSAMHAYGNNAMSKQIFICLQRNGVVCAFLLYCYVISQATIRLRYDYDTTSSRLIVEPIMDNFSEPHWVLTDHDWMRTCRHLGLTKKNEEFQELSLESPWKFAEFQILHIH